jgi:hypothetical protein
MNSRVSASDHPTLAAPLSLPPDYYARALALWPRLERHRLARVKHDPGRVAALVARRTTLPRAAILELLGAPRAETDTSSRDH